MSAARRFRLVLAAAALAATGLMADAARRWSVTFDEPVNIALGWAALHGDLRCTDQGLGPLGRMMCAAPLLGLDLTPPPFEPRGAWSGPPAVGHAHLAGGRFLFENRVGAVELVRRARVVPILLAVTLVAAAAATARWRHGPAGGITAALLLAFEPVLLGQGPLASTDVPMALFGFVAVEACRRHRVDPRAGWLILGGACLGAALSTKTSALLVGPLVLAAVALPGTGMSAGRRARALVVVGAVAALVVLVAYELRPAELLNTWLAVRGQGHAALPPESYMFGRRYGRAQPHYYLVALVLKGSLALVSLVLARAAVDVLGARRGRTRPVDAADLGLAAAVVVAVTTAAHGNYGVRHVLLAVPFLAVYAAGLPRRAAEVLGRPWGRRARAVVAVALAWHLGETLRAHPDYIQFFSAVWGGPSAGPSLLADSNIDMGQEMATLARDIEARGLRGVYLVPSWVGDPGVYGVRYQRLLCQGIGVPLGDLEFRPGDRRCLAIHLNLLLGVGFPPEEYDWLSSRPRLAVVGGSFVLFDVSDPDALVRIAANLRASGEADRAAECLAEAERLGAGPAHSPR